MISSASAPRTPWRAHQWHSRGVYSRTRARQASGSLSRRRWSRVKAVPGGGRCAGGGVSSRSSGLLAIDTVRACCYGGAIPIIAGPGDLVDDLNGSASRGGPAMSQGGPMPRTQCLTSAELAAFHHGDLPEGDLEEMV